MPNEVQHALTRFPHTALAIAIALALALAIAHGIILENAGSPTATASGGTLEVHRPWRPRDVDLKPLGYTYSIPPLS